MNGAPRLWVNGPPAVAWVSCVVSVHRHVSLRRRAGAVARSLLRFVTQRCLHHWSSFSNDARFLRPGDIGWHVRVHVIDLRATVGRCYAWLRTVHSPLRLYQRKMLCYVALLMAAGPVIGPMFMASSYLAEPRKPSGIAAIVLFVAWGVASLFNHAATVLFTAGQPPSGAKEPTK